MREILIMLCLPEIKIPKNCHDCDAIGISDIVGLKCPCETDKTLYDFDERPEKCPLKELKLNKMDESMKKKVEYLDWYFTCDDGTADKDVQKAWFELRKFCITKN